MAFMLMISALVWCVPDKTGEVDDGQSDDNYQNDARAADMVRIHGKNRFRFNSEILTNEKQDLESRLINIPVLR